VSREGFDAAPARLGLILSQHLGHNIGEVLELTVCLGAQLLQRLDGVLRLAGLVVRRLRGLRQLRTRPLRGVVGDMSLNPTVGEGGFETETAFHWFPRSPLGRLRQRTVLPTPLSSFARQLASFPRSGRVPLTETHLHLHPPPEPTWSCLPREAPVPMPSDLYN
jgi:hypothetical protein